MVISVIQAIEERFGKMSVTRGKEHTFVGMDINYNDDGMANINMKNYIAECIETFG